MEGSTIYIHYLSGKKRKVAVEYWEGLPIFTLAYVSAIIRSFLVCWGTEY